MLQTTAQQIADCANTQGLFAAMHTARQYGTRRAVWFAGCEYVFDDGSVLVLRDGAIESPQPTPVVYTHHDA